MEARHLALLILVPFAVIFLYCSWHEYRRFKTEGRSTYGLSYDRETNTTHVGAIPEDEESFDPDDFDPDLLETEAREQDEAEAGEEATSDDDDDDDRNHASNTDHPDSDDKTQDSRT
ncbi:MAG: hypothetical protein R6V26_07890 [Roseovarius sp.]